VGAGVSPAPLDRKIETEQTKAHRKVGLLFSIKRIVILTPSEAEGEGSLAIPRQVALSS
jgi:hypothetical protein